MFNNVKKLMAVSVCIAAFSLSAGCSKSSVSSIDPDAFAKAVNHYEDMSMSHDGIAQNCGQLYVKHGDMPFREALLADCKKAIPKLAAYLQNDPRFNMLSVDDLESAEIWKIYFQSKYARGRG